jgi:hypothetical protein
MTDDMWYCPECQAWNGSKLDRCLECDRPTPRLPVLTTDVPVDDSRRVTTRMRVRAKARRLTELM